MKVQVFTDPELVLDVGDITRQDNGVLVEIHTLVRIDCVNLCHFHGSPSIGASQDVDWLVITTAAEWNDDELLIRSREAIINECHFSIWLSAGDEESECKRRRDIKVRRAQEKAE